MGRGRDCVLCRGVQLQWPARVAHPHTGYLQTFVRLQALLAVHFPVVWAPYFATGASLLADVLPGAVFVSDRFHQVVPSRIVRVLLVLTTIALPGFYEVNGNLANAQWHLALLGFVLLLAPPRTRVGHVLDLAALVTLLWSVCQARLTPLRALALGLLTASLLIGVPGDWHYGAQPNDTGFRVAAQTFDRSPPGTIATLPIAPPPWTMTLKKRQ
jgi:hypothetical protein